MTQFTLYDTITGDLDRIVPDARYAKPGQTAKATSDEVNQLYWDWSRSEKTWTYAPAKHLALVKSQLCADLKIEAERRQMDYASPGGFKKRIYSRKDEEVANWYRLAGLGATVAQILVALNLLPVPVQRRMFRYAMWDAKLRGETDISAAIARFEAGMALSDEPGARIEGIAQERCDAVKAATTVTGAQAARAAVNWARTA